MLAARDRWREVAVPGGTVEALLPPAASRVCRPAWAGTAVGEHTEAILTELGRSPGEIAALRADGVV
ncbi:hypothetical protein GCM10023238_00470 [Streptomyces heliomycini]